VPFAASVGHEVYPDLITQAAVLIERLVRNHPLPDGNPSPGTRSTMKPSWRGSASDAAVCRGKAFGSRVAEGSRALTAVR
jgi:hypothetical protein